MSTIRRECCCNFGKVSLVWDENFDRCYVGCSGCGRRTQIIDRITGADGMSKTEDEAVHYWNLNDLDKNSFAVVGDTVEIVIKAKVKSIDDDGFLNIEIDKSVKKDQLFRVHPKSVTIVEN